MIVLDYPRHAHNGRLTIPPFHMGHMGLVPGSRVRVDLLAPKHGHSSCELLISPFRQERQNMAMLTCTLKDVVGVVGQLVKAISDLEINIVTQESTALHYLNYHHVNLLLDLSNSRLPAEHISTKYIRSYYADYDALFPTDDCRFVTIFESVIARCGDVLVWSEASMRSLPRLRIQPLIKRDVLIPHGDAIIERLKGKLFRTSVAIPKRILGELVNRLRVGHDSELPYLLCSDTDERVIRVLFPEPEVFKDIIHLGFYHQDRFGALAALLPALAEAQFNIVSSVLRSLPIDHSNSGDVSRDDGMANVWEAVLQYKKSLPELEDTEAQCKWLASEIIANAVNAAELKEYGIEVGLPLYPMTKCTFPPVRPPFASHSPADAPVTDLQSLGDLLVATYRRLDDGPANAASVRLVQLVKNRVISETRPLIFLSYPKAAEEHAELVRDRLKDRFDFKDGRQIDYGAPNSNVIIQRIKDCTMFIGIWHHDEAFPIGNGRFHVSPWLQFEYGVAATFDKDILLVHSDKVDDSVWNRIDPSVQHPSYTDLFFRQDTLPNIDEFCRRHVSDALR